MACIGSGLAGEWSKARGSQFMLSHRQGSRSMRLLATDSLIRANCPILESRWTLVNPVADRDPAPGPTVAHLSPSFPDSIRTSHTLIWRAHWLVRHQATAAIYVWILSSATRKLTMISKEASFNGRASRQTVEARGPTLASRHSPICSRPDEPFNRQQTDRLTAGGSTQGEMPSI